MASISSRWRLVFILALAGTGVANAVQGASQSTDPQITVQGICEVTSTPTKASFTVGSTIQLATAPAAAAESARIAKLVTDALRQAGLPHEGIRSSRSWVSPVWDYNQQSKKTTRTGYKASTTLSIETSTLDQVGSYLDAALNAGATEVSSVDFSIADPEAARLEALALAVKDARRQAEAIAIAGGGTLGNVLLFSTASPTSPRPMFSAMTAAARSQSSDIDTQVVIPEIKTDATVLGTWQFLPK